MGILQGAMPMFVLISAFLMRGTRIAPLQMIGAELYGPAPAPIARIRGRARARLLVKAPKGAPLQAALRRWRAAVKIPSSVRVAIDIDPQSFL